MSAELVKILDGNTFVVSDERGDIEASLTDPTGPLLLRHALPLASGCSPSTASGSTRFGGRPPVLRDRFFLVPGTGTVYIDAKLSVIRQRAVGGGFHEELTILNHDEKPVDLDGEDRGGLRLRRPVRGQGRAQEEGRVLPRVDDGALVLGYERETYVRETWISAPRAVQPSTSSGLTFSVHVEPHGEWTTDLHVTTGRAAGGRMTGRSTSGTQDAPTQHGAQPGEVARTTRRASTATGTAQADLPAQPGRPRGAAVLAGVAARPLPAGRRAALVHDHVRPRQHLHQPAGAAVHARARGDDALGPGDVAGLAVDDFRDEDPGRILHELRFGEMTAFEERPHSPYYGSVDATPLYVVLLDEYERWTGDTKLVKRARASGARGARLDRRVRRPAGQRLHRLQAPQRAVRPREPVLEGLLGFDLLPRRPAARLPARHL